MHLSNCSNLLLSSDDPSSTLIRSIDTSTVDIIRTFSPPAALPRLLVLVAVAAERRTLTNTMSLTGKRISNKIRSKNSLALVMPHVRGYFDTVFGQFWIIYIRDIRVLLVVVFGATSRYPYGYFYGYFARPHGYFLSQSCEMNRH